MILRNRFSKLNYKRLALFAGLFLIYRLDLWCQNQGVADSLEQIVLTQDIDDSLEISLLFRIAYNQNDTQKKLKYAQDLVNRTKDSENVNWTRRAYFILGNSLRLIGDIEEAVEAYLKCAELAAEQNHQRSLGETYVALGDIYSVSGSHNNSIDYYKRAIEIFEKTRDSTSLTAAYINIGDQFFSNRNFESALTYFNEAGELCELLNLEYYAAVNLGNIGLVYAELGNDQRAEKNISLATEKLTELGDRYAVSVYHTYMADIYRGKGENKRALNYAELSFEIAYKDGLKEQIRDASLKLSELYDELGEPKKALRNLQNYIAYRDSINNAETIQKIADLRREFEVSQKQAEVDLLTAQRQIQRIIGFSLIGGLIFVVVFASIQYRNNIQKKKTNRILSDQKTKLEELNQTKDRFFSIISHDLRGPVNAFHGVSRMIKFFVQQKQMGQLEELAEDIDQSVDRLSSLLDNLLNWAVQQQGNFPYVPEKLDIRAMAEDLVKTFTTMANSKQITLISEVTLSTEAWADRNTTMTIIRNLVSNALKFTPQEGEVKIKAVHKGESILIQVTDNGVGIPAEKLNDLFKLQAKKSTWGTDGEKGLGLGLQLVHEFVELNKGKIDVESTADQGTTFSVWLPVFEEVAVPENV